MLSTPFKRGKVTHEPGSFSGAGSAKREGRAYVIHVDNRARVTYAAATTTVRAHDSTVKKDAVLKVPRCAPRPFGNR